MRCCPWPHVSRHWAGISICSWTAPTFRTGWSNSPSLPVPLVIDHNGKFLSPPGVDAPQFRALCSLMDTGRCWIKLSAPYETSRTGAPDYADVSLLARTLAQAYPQRCLWASNWPHVGRASPPGMPTC